MFEMTIQVVLKTVPEYLGIFLKLSVPC